MDACKSQFFNGQVAQFSPGRLDEVELAKLDWFRTKWELRPGMAIVEPGCGAGRITQWLLPLVGREGRIIALDPSPQMVAAHREHIQAENVTCMVADAETVVLPAAQADRVLCCCVFPHFEDKVLALRNLARSLKPSGRLCVAHLHTREELNGLHSDAGAPVREDRLPDAGEMQRLFANAGLWVNEIVDEAGRYHLSARLA